MRRLFCAYVVLILVSVFLCGCQQNEAAKQTVTVDSVHESAPTPTPKPHIVSIQATENSVFLVYNNGENEIIGFGDSISQAQNVIKTDCFYDEFDIQAKAVLYNNSEGEGLVYVFLKNNECISNAFGGTKIIDVAAGDGFVAGLTKSGEVLVYPSNATLQIGEDEEPIELDVSDWTGVTQIDAGANHVVGLKADGTVVATGDNIFGQCNVSEWNGIKSVSAGNGMLSGTNYTLGLKKDGTLIITCKGESFEEKLYRNAIGEFSDIVSMDASSSTIAGMNGDGELIVFFSDARLFLGKIVIEDILDYDVLGNSVIVMNSSGELESITSWNALLYDKRWQSSLNDVITDGYYFYAYNDEMLLESYMQIFDTNLLPDEENSNSTEVADPEPSKTIDQDKLEKDWLERSKEIEKRNDYRYSIIEKKYLKADYADADFRKILFLDSLDKTLLSLDSQGILRIDQYIANPLIDGQPWELACSVAIADFCVLPNEMIIALTETGDFLISPDAYNVYVLEQKIAEMNDSIELFGGSNIAAIYDGDGLVMPKALSFILNPFFYDPTTNFASVFNLEDTSVLKDYSSTATPKSSTNSSDTTNVKSQNIQSWEDFVSPFDGVMPNYIDVLSASRDYFLADFTTFSSSRVAAVFYGVQEKHYEEFRTITIDAGYNLESEDSFNEGTSILSSYIDDKTGAEIKITFVDNDDETQLYVWYIAD